LQNLDQLEAVYEKSHETIIGNCDTTLFLGSNSQKTVEYFSKELGEKTINRDSWSVSKDKHMWKQGFNKQDQIMARALMTPDELRRLDNDLCIIFEKGVRPIKAPKYYYFKYSTVKLVEQYKCSHNDIDPIDRGKWRKYNPYNPYVEETEEQKENTKIESLDDLFEEDKPSDNKKDILANDDLLEEKSTEEEVLTYDIQKELEAKFDELFGALEED